MADEGKVSVFMGVWFSTVVLVVVCIILTYNATRESVIMNTDAYKVYLQKLFKKKN